MLVSFETFKKKIGICNFYEKTITKKHKNLCFCWIYIHSPSGHILLSVSTIKQVLFTYFAQKNAYIFEAPFISLLYSLHLLIKWCRDISQTCWCFILLSLRWIRCMHIKQEVKIPNILSFYFLNKRKSIGYCYTSCIITLLVFQPRFMLILIKFAIKYWDGNFWFYCVKQVIYKLTEWKLQHCVTY